MPDVHLQPGTGRQVFAVVGSVPGSMDLTSFGEWRTLHEHSWLRWQLRRLEDRTVVLFEADTESPDLPADSVVRIDERTLDPQLDAGSAPEVESRTSVLDFRGAVSKIKGLVNRILGKEEDAAGDEDTRRPIPSRAPGGPGMEKLTIHVNQPAPTARATLVVDFGNTQSAAVVVVGPSATEGMHRVRYLLGGMPNRLLPRLQGEGTRIRADVIQPSCVLFTSAVAQDIGRISAAIGIEAQTRIEVESASRHIPTSSYCYVPKRYLVYDQEGQWTDWNEPHNPVRLADGPPEICSIAGFFLLNFFQRIREELNGVQNHPHDNRVEIERVYLTYPLAFSEMERNELLRWARNAASQALGCQENQILLGVDEAAAAETFFFFLQLDLLCSSFALLQQSFRVSSNGEGIAHGSYPPPPADGLRILTFDCGGGTTDISLADVTWQQKVGALHRTVHAYDTFFFGGDDLTRCIIVDLVALIEKQTGIPASHFHTDLEVHDPEIQTRNRILFTHLLHLANRVKHEFSKPGREPGSVLSINFQNVAKHLRNGRLLAQRGTNGWSLNADGRFARSGSPEHVHYTYEAYRDLFHSRRNPLRPVADRSCALARETGTDVVLLTGMTCRTPFIKEMFVERTHLPASSVISLDRLATSDWRPLTPESRTGQVDKLAVALGAACRCASEYYAYVPSVVRDPVSRVGVQVGRFQQNRIPGPIISEGWVPPSTSGSNPAQVMLEVVNQNMLVLGFRYARQAQGGNGAGAQPFAQISTASNQTANGVLTLKFTSPTQFVIEDFKRKPDEISGAQEAQHWVVKHISYSWDDYFLVTGRFWEER